MIAIPMGIKGDYHLYPESQIKHIIVLRNIITLYMEDIQLCITNYTKEEWHYEPQTTFLPKKDFAYFKASILESAVGFNPLLCSERGDQSDKVRLPGTDFVEGRNVRSGNESSD